MEEHKILFRKLIVVGIDNSGHLSHKYSTLTELILAVAGGQ
jgi:hypothetical protein